MDAISIDQNLNISIWNLISFLSVKFLLLINSAHHIVANSLVIFCLWGIGFYLLNISLKYVTTQLKSFSIYTSLPYIRIKKHKEIVWSQNVLYLQLLSLCVYTYTMYFINSCVYTRTLGRWRNLFTSTTT